MKRLFVIPVVVVLIFLGACASAQDVSDLAGLKSDPEKYARAVSELVSDAIKQNDLSTALGLLDYFDAFPICPEAARCRYDLAVELNKQQDYQTAAELLEKNVDTDPWGREGPQSIELLTDILGRVYQRNDDAEYLLKQLAVYYYQEIPSVVRARDKLGAKLPIIPSNKMILLDATLGEARICDRCAIGSCNFGQFEVIKILVEAGYIVHSNDTIPRGQPNPRMLADYGLIIMNNKYGGTSEPPIPQAVNDTLTAYVNAGGSLLVIASGSAGEGKTPAFYNPLIGCFGLQFAEGSALVSTDCIGRQLDKDGKAGSSTGKPADPNPARLSDFYITGGTPVTSDSGTVLGLYDNIPVIVASEYGKGKVIAAGIGSALLGGPMCRLGKPEVAEMGKNLLLNLTAYLLSGR